MVPRLNTDGSNQARRWRCQVPVICAISRIRRFVEKPSPEVARELYDRNYLWNSFVLIANTTTLLSLIAKALPDLYSALSGVRPFFGGAAEGEILQTIYRQLRSADFSASVLAAYPAEFSVLPVKGVSWSDLGDPKRLLAAISNSGRHILGGNQNVLRSQPFAVTDGQTNQSKQSVSGLSVRNTMARNSANFRLQRPLRPCPWQSATKSSTFTHFSFARADFVIWV